MYFCVSRSAFNSIRGHPLPSLTYPRRTFFEKKKMGANHSLLHFDTWNSNHKRNDRQSYCTRRARFNRLLSFAPRTLRLIDSAVTFASREVVWLVVERPLVSEKPHYESRRDH